MASRTIKLSFPGESREEVLISISHVRVNKDSATIYDTVSIFEEEIFPRIRRRLRKEKVGQSFELKKVLNIHNDDGIRDLGQVREMIKDIKTGRHILCLGIPNIKLVGTIRHQMLLFDGHHSALAYMACGKRYLEEVPHMIIVNKEKDYIDNKYMTVFFGEHAKEMKDFEWQNKVINWQAPKEKQLCKRAQRNMGELFDALKERMQVV